MLKKYSAMVSLLLFASLCIAQRLENSPAILPHPVYQNGKALYIDRSGKVVLTTTFDYGYSFSERLAAFKDHDKIGFIDERGEVVIKPSFDSVKDFSDGLAAVEINDRWGYIDRTGRRIIRPQFDEANSFSEGLALVGLYVGDQPDGDDIYKYGFIDKMGKMVIGKTNKRIVIGMRTFTSPKFDEARDFSEGLAPVRVGAHWGYVNRQGQFAIQLKFEGAKGFSDGLAPVTPDGVKWGYIDKSGKIIIAPQFADAGSFSEGLAPIAVYRNGSTKEWGYVDSNGQVLIKPQFYGAEKFNEGMAIIFEPARGGFGYIDNTGKVIIKPQFDGVGMFINGIAWAATPKDKGGYIYKTGEYVWKPEPR